MSLSGPTPGRIAELEQEDKAKAAVIEQEVLQIFKAKQVRKQSRIDLYAV